MDAKQLEAMRRETTVNCSELYCDQKINFVSRLTEKAIWAMEEAGYSTFLSMNIGNDVISFQIPNHSHAAHEKLASLIASEETEGSPCRGFSGYIKNGLAEIKALEHEVLVYHIVSWEDSLYDKVYGYHGVKQDGVYDERINYMSSMIEIATWAKEKIGCHFLSVDIGYNAVSMCLPGNGSGSHGKIAGLLACEEIKGPICRGFDEYVKNGSAEVKAFEHKVLVYHIGEWSSIAKIDLDAMKKGE